MQKRNLGKSMKVSSVGLGCMGITHASGTADKSGRNESVGIGAGNRL